MPKEQLTTYTRLQLKTMLEAASSLQEALSHFELESRTEPTDDEREHLPRATFSSPPGVVELNLADRQRRLCERVINVFETGTVNGKYGAISIYHDGPGGRRQITYGRSQTTEYGNLRELIDMYSLSTGQFSHALAPYVPKIGSFPLVDDLEFKRLLRDAGSDPVMQDVQNQFFDKVYFAPALRWANGHGFETALSALVIYDSFIHSGGILGFLRERFSERTPDRGGDEKAWIKQYIDVRHNWLSNHSNPEIRASNYRTKDLAREIAKGNWDLAILPFMANGTPVTDGAVHGRSVLGRQTESLQLVEWSELEPFAERLSHADGNESEAARLAKLILNNPRITLATSHVSGVRDNANAHQNIVDTAGGLDASRSEYGAAPGGTVALNARMLQGLLDLADDFSFEVSELCGGEHSPTSRHYRGATADVNVINGRHVSAGHPDQAAFRRECSSLGATQVLGPGDKAHSTHIHAAWPA